MQVPQKRVPRRLGRVGASRFRPFPVPARQDRGDALGNGFGTRPVSARIERHGREKA